jgi:hypothetical protein
MASVRRACVIGCGYSLLTLFLLSGSLVVTLDTKEYRMTFFCDGSQQYSYSHSSYMNRDGQLSIDGKTMQMFNSNDRSQTGAVQVAFVEVVSTKLTPMDVSVCQLPQCKLFSSSRSLT